MNTRSAGRGLYAPFRSIKLSGFSLVELLVVVAVIGALAAAGVVGYQNYSRDSKIEAGAYNMNSVFRFMLNVRQQLPLANSLGGNCEIRIGADCATVESDPEDFLEAFRSKVAQEYGFSNPIHTKCPVTVVTYASSTHATTASQQMLDMGLNTSLINECEIQTNLGVERVEGAIYFSLQPRPGTRPLEYFEARMFMPCKSIAKVGTLCQ